MNYLAFNSVNEAVDGRRAGDECHGQRDDKRVDVARRMLRLPVDVGRGAGGVGRREGRRRRLPRHHAVVGKVEDQQRAQQLQHRHDGASPFELALQVERVALVRDGHLRRQCHLVDGRRDAVPVVPGDHQYLKRNHKKDTNEIKLFTNFSWNILEKWSVVFLKIAHYMF